MGPRPSCPLSLSSIFPRDTKPQHFSGSKSPARYTLGPTTSTLVLYMRFNPGNILKSTFFASSTFSSQASNMAKKPRTIPEPTVPTAIQSREIQKTDSGGGCFWGVEHEFTSYFGHLPSFKAVSGYTGGTSENPTYREVCSGRTGHAEAVKVTYDKSSVGYGELVEFFFRTHDPTTADRQGGDRGSQYRSAIFTNSDEQSKIALAVKDEVQKKYFDPKGSRVVTQMASLGKWYDAEDYHQLYLDVNPDGYQCATHHLHW
ncbi:Peptide methionine sulfoxide reductase [Phaffia rhodozyma]|uniref:peptide-methionine (S)-S-oxide reductase n=1 Tax=Phaffia rhodozyma TaxID=264483 RepID=A0A0F7SU22_PHARH|nr:Peptide methionine sulfoxide reductase [Phaffia rhodozyma]